MRDRAAPVRLRTLRGVHGEGMNSPTTCAGDRAVRGQWQTIEVPPTPEDFALHAWVDESMRTANVSAPMYMLGAVVTDPLACDAAREELRRILPGGLKLHWRDLEHVSLML